MINSEAIAELLHYGDWARERLLEPVSELSDDQLDRPFDMGPGTLRGTLRHIYFAELIWARRLGVSGWQALPPADTLSAAAEIAGNHAALAQAYATWLRALPSAALRETLAYVDVSGRSRTSFMGDALLHMCNHGVHHRAQAVNMLRAIGRPLPAPGIDYIFMRLKSEAAAPTVTRATFQRYFAYNDWATSQLMDAAHSLADEQLDESFEMGMGTLRATLGHVCDSERWWLENWMCGPKLYPSGVERAELGTIRSRQEETAVRRDEFLRSVENLEELRRPVTARPRADLALVFPLNVTMLQLCMHGTHHRAQAVNMVRRLGGAAPELDYVHFARERPGD